MDSKDFPCGSAGKESACNTGDLYSIPGLGRSLGEWNGYPLQYSGLKNSGILENSMDHKSRFGLSPLYSKDYALFYSVFDGWMASLTRWVWASSGSWWWTGKPGVLQSMRLQRVGHDWETELNWIQNNLWSSCIQGNIKERKNGLKKKARTYIRLYGYGQELLVWQMRL